MSPEVYKDLATHLPKGYIIPESFSDSNTGDGCTCIFLVSCLRADRILYIEDTCRDITGYAKEKFIKNGMDFWFPLIHPEDMPAFTDKIIRAHRKMAEPGFKKEEGLLLVFEYRFRDPRGNWIRVRDTKYMLFHGKKVTADMILCKFELIDQATGAGAVENMLHSERSCSRMLDFALTHQNAQQKQPVETPLDQWMKTRFKSRPALTRREREILKLIGDGLSTKMIASQCAITINTVETHRRHLLEKLNVKNSMELIKEASKVFWL